MSLCNIVLVIAIKITSLSQYYQSNQSGNTKDNK